MKISVDLDNTRRECVDLKKSLRKERLRLMQEKAEEHGVSVALVLDADEALDSIGESGWCRLVWSEVYALFFDFVVVDVFEEMEPAGRVNAAKRFLHPTTQKR